MASRDEVGLTPGRLLTPGSVDVTPGMELDMLTRQVSMVEYHRVRLDDYPLERTTFENELARLEVMEIRYSKNVRARKERGANLGLDISTTAFPGHNIATRVH